MCDPLTLGALAVGAAGTAANSVGQAKAARKQEEAYNQWAANQKKIRANENVRQDELRGQAQASQQQGVADISADAQAKAQAEEQARLAALLSEQGAVKPTGTPTAPAAVADAALSGQQYGGEVFQSDLARGIADAAASAKQRIGALATVQSYGGSYGGLGTRNPLVQQEAGSGIDLANAGRKGSLGAYESERAVDPMQISYSNPVADVASQFLGVGLQGLGGMGAGGTGLGGGAGASSLGKVFSSAFRPKAKVDPWAGMRAVNF